MARKKKNNEVDFTKMELVPSRNNYVDRGFHFYLSYNMRIALFVVSIIMLLVGAYYCVTNSYNGIGVKKLGYNENGNASDYVVKVKESDLVPNGEMDAGMSYVRDNIESIDANFKYNIYFSNLADIRYEYDVVADLYIYGDDDKLLAPVQTTQIIDKKNINLRNSNKFNLTLPVKINYKEFLAKANDYFTANGVTGTAKVLVTMEVSSIVDYQAFNDIVVKNSIVQMEIPLTSQNNQIQIKTTNYNDDDRFERVVIGEPTDEKLLYVGLVMFVLGVVSFIYFVSFVFKTIPKKSKYVLLRDGLLKEFDQKIVNVKEFPVVEGQNIIDCYSFSELLDAQDTLKKPILYNEIVKNQKCIFLIVDGENVFRYVLKEVDLEFK